MIVVGSYGNPPRSAAGLSSRFVAVCATKDEVSDSAADVEAD